MTSRPPGNVPHIKGSLFAEVMREYLERADEGGVRALIAGLPQESRAGLDATAPSLGIVVSNWYPTVLVHRLLDQLIQERGEEGARAVAQAATQTAVARSLRGLYAALFSLVATPERYAKHIQRAWGQLHDTGRREVVIEGPGVALSVTSDWAGHHPLLCEMTSETTRLLFDRMGCKDVAMLRMQCVKEGARDCRARVTWRP